MPALKKIVKENQGRIEQLLEGAGNNQQARASDIDPIIDVVNNITGFGTAQPITGTTGAFSGNVSVGGNATVSGSLTRKVPVTAGAASTILTAAQSGGVFLFDATTVEAYTLPAAATGLTFTFVWTATAAGTLDIHTVTAAAGDFLGGSIIMALEATTPGANPGPKIFTGDGSTHTIYTGNGSTTGGVKGGQVTFTAISSTIWMVTGVVLATGAIATPFS